MLYTIQSAMLWEGAMMKSRFFSKKDEVILSAFTALVIGGLLYQGFTALFTGREHAMFQKNSIVISKK